MPHCALLAALDVAKQDRHSTLAKHAMEVQLLHELHRHHGAACSYADKPVML